MLTSFLVVAPIFGLIFVGYGCRRLGVFGVNATTELNRFVVILALPALLFDVTVHMTRSDFFQPGFMVAFGGGTAIIFVGTVLFQVRRTQSLPDASIDGLNAAYANAGFVGFPLCMAVFGSSSASLTTIATVLTACVLFAIAIVLTEVGSHHHARAWHATVKVIRSLMKNPLLMAPLAGSLGLGGCSTTGFI